MYIPTHLPDTQALTEFREQTAHVLKKLARSGKPLLITQKGKAAGVVMSPRLYEAMADAAALARSIEGVRQSLADFHAGRVMPADEALQQLAKKHQPGTRTGKR